ncbi:SdiA-regulated domain-containing protein [Rhodocytophaga aerolata]|nr:SdiA-regulated domain-containing protein [Rhodocytophaga aerolata]
MKRFLLKVVILFMLYIHTACTGSSTDQSSGEGELSKAFPYRINEPSERFWLPSELEEISGVMYVEDGILGAVQDEKGILYIYDTKSTAVINRIRFGASGDYEDLTLAGEAVYLVRSDGNLYKTSLTGTTPAEIIDTPLSGKNDVEGLAYDAENNRLLLACKGISGIEKDDSGNRAVFAFDLKNNTLQPDPVFVLSVKEVKQLTKSKESFRPSGIAIHPVNGLVYVLASVGKVLVVLNKNGSIEAVQPLPARYFKQPEGICFAPNGDLFISNEGRGSMASILRYNFAP